jgi:hypothetical protein
MDFQSPLPTKILHLFPSFNLGLHVQPIVYIRYSNNTEHMTFVNHIV